MMFPKSKPWRSQKYRDAAKGQDCKLRFPGCRNETETVVLAHRNGAGMGTKASDHDACDCCDHCHSILDGRKKLTSYELTELENECWDGCNPMTLGEMLVDKFNRARLETIINRIERGILR